MNRRARNKRRKAIEEIKREGKKEVAERMYSDGWGGHAILKYTDVDSYYLRHWLNVQKRIR
jgi:hypothetical protein